VRPKSSRQIKHLRNDSAGMRRILPRTAAQPANNRREKRSPIKLL
jgi:hypothetical protein